MMSEKENKPVLNLQQNIRRRLLTAAVYTPPAILGTMMVGPRYALGAWGQTETCKMNPTAAGVPVPTINLTISSGASACCPCIPSSQKFNAAKCSKYQCVKSCGGNTAACASIGGIANIPCDKFCKKGPPGCTPPAGCNQPCKCRFSKKENEMKWFVNKLSIAQLCSYMVLNYLITSQHRTGEHYERSTCYNVSRFSWF